MHFMLLKLLRNLTSRFGNRNNPLFISRSTCNYSFVSHTDFNIWWPQTVGNMSICYWHLKRNRCCIIDSIRHHSLSSQPTSWFDITAKCSKFFLHSTTPHRLSWASIWSRHTVRSNGPAWPGSIAPPMWKMGSKQHTRIQALCQNVHRWV